MALYNLWSIRNLNLANYRLIRPSNTQFGGLLSLYLAKDKLVLPTFVHKYVSIFTRTKVGSGLFYY